MPTERETGNEESKGEREIERETGRKTSQDEDMRRRGSSMRLCALRHKVNTILTCDFIMMGYNWNAGDVNEGDGDRDREDKREEKTEGR